jgi:mannose-6-phosphate isomerase-like protein (cupin superfamily)
MTRPAELPRGRVIETGCGATGESTITSDECHELVMLASGRVLSQLWKTDRLVATCESGGSAAGLFPESNGLRLWILVIPPDGDRTAGAMHATPTVDFGFVLRGSVALEMEDGSSSVLQAGDAFVQAGTEHRWRNPAAEPAVLGVVVIGATPAAQQSAPANDNDRIEHHQERGDDDAGNG